MGARQELRMPSFVFFSTAARSPRGGDTADIAERRKACAPDSHETERQTESMNFSKSVCCEFSLRRVVARPRSLGRAGLGWTRFQRSKQACQPRFPRPFFIGARPAALPSAQDSDVQRALLSARRSPELRMPLAPPASERRT